MDGSAPAPFLMKTYEMVEDPMTNSVVSWNHTGHSFVVWNPPEFARDLLPKYFKHNNFSSFIRQLNTYGFRKVDPDQWEFANDEFIRGQSHLLKNIHRRKPIHSHSVPVQLNASEREELEKEIEKLKLEKLNLQSEIEQHKQEKETYEHKITSLGHTLQSISHRQSHLLNTMSQILHKSKYTSNFPGQPEWQNKKRKVFALNYLHDEANQDDSKPSPPLINLEAIEKLESSLNVWETFLHRVDQTQSEEFHNFGTPLVATPVVITKNPLLSGHPDLTPSPDCRSSADLAASSNYVESPTLSSICIDHLSGFDVNARPNNSAHAQVQKHRGGQDVINMQGGGNDVFWQQFLTEAPGLPVTQEVQSERRDLDDNKTWWNVDKLSQQMEHHLARVD